MATRETNALVILAALRKDKLASERFFKPWVHFMLLTKSELGHLSVYLLMVTQNTIEKPAYSFKYSSCIRILIKDWSIIEITRTLKCAFLNKNRRISKFVQYLWDNYKHDWEHIPIIIPMTA